MTREFTCELDGFVEIVARDPARISIAEITGVYVSDRDDLATIARLARLDALPVDWQRYFAQRLASHAPPRRSTRQT